MAELGIEKLESERLGAFFPSLGGHGWPALSTNPESRAFLCTHAMQETSRLPLADEAPYVLAKTVHSTRIPPRIPADALGLSSNQGDRI